MSTYLCAGIRVSFSLSISRYCLSLTQAMLRHSRRAGDFPAKISGQDMPVKTQGAGLYESAQDFSLFYFFLFLRCLSGYLFFLRRIIKINVREIFAEKIKTILDGF